MTCMKNRAVHHMLPVPLPCLYNGTMAFFGEQETIFKGVIIHFGNRVLLRHLAADFSEIPLIKVAAFHLCNAA